jgi:aspartyl-tRNA(Asn)/glutamyl-tRNA(Gln) amidotransferase subunit A
MSRAWLAMTAMDLGREIGAGRITPVELTEAFLDAIETAPEAARIYARITPGRARAEAMAAHDRAKAGLRQSPLDGVPLSWKDLFDTAGIATEAGSALLKGRVPARDAVVVDRATRAGTICLGKTHMSELAFSGLGLNPVTATPPCINDPRAVPGGSTSGGAASVAFRLAPAAIGSDTGGSCRIPAAWNDLVGFKPTHGRLPLDGVVPLAARFDTVGPLARSVEDCAALTAILDDSPVPDLRDASLAGARLAVLDTVAFDDIRDRPARGFDAALARLTRAGASATRLPIPAVAEALTLAGILVTAEAWATWAEAIEANPGAMFPRIRERFESGAAVTARAWIAATDRLARLRAAYAAAVAPYDAVVLPTAPILPPDARRLETDEGYYVTENLLALRNTRIANLMGLTAITLPTPEPSCGIMLMAAAGHDTRLLRLAAAAEAALA